MFRRMATIAVLVSLATLAAAADDAAPLTEQDIVLWHVGGMPTDEIVAKIAESEVEFDLSEEMLDELRIAGIPEEVLTAMKRRQLESTPAPPPGTEVLLDEGGATLVVKLNPDREEDAKPATVRALNAIDPRLAEALGIRGDEPTITDLGIALYCRTADHVPDHWRSKSPIGRDFNVPRHAVLTYLGGATSEPAAKWKDTLSKLVKAQVWRESMIDLELLTLEVPAELTLEVEPGVAHDLSIALVIQLAGRSYVALSDDLDGVIVRDGERKTLLADLLTRKKDPLKAKVGFREPDTD